MGELKVIGAEHQDHKRERRVHLDALGKAITTIPAGLKRIIPNRAPAIQAILGDAYFEAEPKKIILEDTGPTAVKRKPHAGIWNDAPSNRIRIYKDVVHLPQRSLADG